MSCSLNRFWNKDERRILTEYHNALRSTWTFFVFSLIILVFIPCLCFITWIVYFYVVIWSWFTMGILWFYINHSLNTFLSIIDILKDVQSGYIITPTWNVYSSAVNFPKSLNIIFYSLAVFVWCILSQTWYLYSSTVHFGNSLDMTYPVVCWCL